MKVDNFSIGSGHQTLGLTSNLCGHLEDFGFTVMDQGWSMLPYTDVYLESVVFHSVFTKGAHLSRP